MTHVLLATLLAALAWTPAEAEAPGRHEPNEGQKHVPEGTTVHYRHYPPSSGPHWPTPADWGVYDQPVPPERWVHNLEHGGVVILYRCDGDCADLVTRLRDIVATFPREKHGEVKLVVTPAPRLRTPLAIVAWRWVQELPGFDRERLLRFYEAHVDRAPEDVP